MWQRVNQIFDAAIELPPHARAPFLAAACAEEPQLLAEVQSLLAALDQAGSFIQNPPPLPSELADLPAAPPETPAFPTGMDIGPYRIVQSIGQGGMGTVYQAVRVDDLYRKLVALKVIRRGMASEIVMRKFETERHILAHLDHPNIAKLLDGGTTPDGQPYFVMDFICGTPIDQYCDQRQLSIRDRLKLFLVVCSAVDYAHRNFVVHRDIKPGNILVTPEGSVRLLDFGIAKLLDPDTECGESVSVVQTMTPEYASPEQILNEPVTAASDVWSLGILLYGLLTGAKPFHFRSRTPHEVLRVIDATTPRLASTVAPDHRARELRGDLDNILLKALRRDAARRYASVEDLAADIGRHLDGMPVAARPDTFVYRAGKFLARNRAASAATAVAVLALAAGTFGVIRQTNLAAKEHERARHRLDDVRRIDALLGTLHNSLRQLPGADPARAMIVAQEQDFFDSVSRDSLEDPALRRELGRAYAHLGEIQREFGDLQAADASDRKARDLVREACSGDHLAQLKTRSGVIACQT
jgi:non-specific serine/threonine protein kinase/serine/threonine-protein kinase